MPYFIESVLFDRFGDGTPVASQRSYADLILDKIKYHSTKRHTPWKTAPTFWSLPCNAGKNTCCMPAHLRHNAKNLQNAQSSWTCFRQVQCFSLLFDTPVLNHTTHQQKSARIHLTPMPNTAPPHWSRVMPPAVQTEFECPWIYLAPPEGIFHLTKHRGNETVAEITDKPSMGTTNSRPPTIIINISIVSLKAKLMKAATAKKQRFHLGIRTESSKQTNTRACCSSSAVRRFLSNCTITMLRVLKGVSNRFWRRIKFMIPPLIWRMCD